jgi:hypothetical protein
VVVGGAISTAIAALAAPVSRQRRYSVLMALDQVALIAVLLRPACAYTSPSASMERTMIGCRLTAAAIIAVAIMGGTAAAQQRTEDEIFTFHANASGSCPDLDWHLVVAPDNTVTGMIGWQHMQLLVRVTGTVDLETRTFSLVGKEAGGNRTATIEGKILSRNHLMVDIKAPEANIDCPNVEVWGKTLHEIKVGP